MARYSEVAPLFTCIYLDIVILLLGNVGIDEAFILITRDVTKSFLDKKNSKSSTLLCNPHGGISIGLWLNDRPDVITFADNKRLGDLDKKERLKRLKGDEICHTRLGVHRTYPDIMRIYWSIYQKENRNVKSQIPPVTYDCPLPRFINNTKLRAKIRSKLCRENPMWNMGEYWQERKKS